tara:strand:- start:157 stop:375 length:219 start_codon:yes stop_codon:yes gene_type:complete
MLHLMPLRSSALFLALTALTACSMPDKNSASDAEAPASPIEQISSVKAVAVTDALPTAPKMDSSGKVCPMRS